MTQALIRVALLAGVALPMAGCISYSPQPAASEVVVAPQPTYAVAPPGTVVVKPY